MTFNFFGNSIALMQEKINSWIGGGGVRCTERVGDIKIIAEKEKNEKTIF